MSQHEDLRFFSLKKMLSPGLGDTTSNPKQYFPTPNKNNPSGEILFPPQAIFETVTFLKNTKSQVGRYNFKSQTNFPTPNRNNPLRQNIIFTQAIFLQRSFPPFFKKLGWEIQSQISKHQTQRTTLLVTNKTDAARIKQT